MPETVSIIIPVHNAGKFIYDTMEMVRKQTYGEWELILVDDGSQDDSVSIIKKYMEEHGECDISLIVIPVATSAADARNRGLAAARGRYISFLDADDIWKPEKLERELNFLESLKSHTASEIREKKEIGGLDGKEIGEEIGKEIGKEFENAEKEAGKHIEKEAGKHIEREYQRKKSPGFIFTAYEFSDENGIPLGKVVHVPPTLTYKKALSRTVIFTSTVLFDTEVIPKELIKMPDIPSEDTATWWGILGQGHIAYGLDEVLVYYRRHGGSLSSNKLVAMKRIWNLYRKREGLGLLHSCFCFAGWAVRATIRRL